MPENRHLVHCKPFNCLVSRRGGTSRFIPILLVLAASGIYIADSGLRVEHLIVYSLFLISLLVHASRQTLLNKVHPLFLLVVLWSILLMWMVIVTLTLTDTGSLKTILANADNFAIPIAVMFILSAFIRNYSEQDAKKMLLKVCNLFIILLALNGLLTIVQLTTSVSFFFKPFMPPNDPLMGTATWDGSVSMGRYIGVFGSPFESGITYSMGIFVWLYVAISSKRSGKLFKQVLLALIILGGLITISKAFLLGLLLFIACLVANYKYAKTIFNYRLLLTVPLVGILVKMFVEKWKGLDFFLRLFVFAERNPADLIVLFTANRYGKAEAGSLHQAICVWQQAPFTGLGLGDLTVCDSAYLYYLLHGGVVALGIQLLILFVLGWNGIKNYKYCHEGKLLAVLTAYIVIANLGAPVLISNKFSTIFWVITSLLLLIINCKRRTRADNKNTGSIELSN